jgi:hypothetical protein
MSGETHEVNTQGLLLNKKQVNVLGSDKNPFEQKLLTHCHADANEYGCSPKRVSLAVSSDNICTVRHCHRHQLRLHN